MSEYTPLYQADETNHPDTAIEHHKIRKILDTREYDEIHTEGIVLDTVHIHVRAVRSFDPKNAIPPHEPLIHVCASRAYFADAL